MFNKKIIIILAIALFLLSATAVFLWKNKSNNTKNNLALINVNLSNENKLTANQIATNNFNELKNNYPKASTEQLKFYMNVAAENNIHSCLGTADENQCVSAAAFIKGDRNFCHDLSHLENETLYNECASTILKQTAKAEISKCQLLLGDDYYNCLTALLNVYVAPKDCLSLPEAETQAICQDLFNFNTAFFGNDRTLCKNVKTEKLNQYCLKVIN